jgi:uncharacterized membrane protein
MEWLRSVAHDAGAIAWGNRFWMTWNTLLAVLPAMAAVLLFRHRARWGPLSFLGLVAFVLFLPNAPYVVTDLIHLRGDVVLARSDTAVYAGVLPLYGAFIAVGFASYALSLHEVGRWLRRSGRARWVPATELGLHALCAVGVLLGRVARLNSWDTFTRPEGTAEQALRTLSWSGTPLALALLFGVIWLGHATTRVLTRAAATAIADRLPRVRATT